MNNISIIVTCKGRLHHLKESLPKLINRTDDYVLVDYTCPDMCGAWAIANHCKTNVVHISGQQGFHHSKARNIGAAHAKHEWLCFIDADMVVNDETLIENLKLVKGNMYLLDKYDHGYCGFLVIHRDDFNRIAGYNEKMIGWGYEDLDVRYRLTKIGISAVYVDHRGIKHIDHNDVERTQFTPTKDINASNSMNFRISDEYRDRLNGRNKVL